MARATFRPFSKSVSIVDQAAAGVSLTDLGGTVMDCTYVQVVPLEGSVAAVEEGFYMVEPSGLVSKADYVAATSGTLPGDTNASACVIGGPNNPVVELSLGYKSTINSVKISNKLGDTTNFIVTYGQILPSNELTDTRILVDGAYG